MFQSNKYLTVLCFVFMSGTSAALAQTDSAIHSKSDVSQQAVLRDREITLLDLSGGPYERGLAHGKALKTEIKDIILLFKQDLANTYNVDSSVFIKRFMATSNFQPAIKKWTPGLLDEVRGIADGADVPFDEIYVFQLADEIWSMGKWAMKHKCTAISVNRRGDQPTIVAQTMDIPGFYQKYPTLLRIRYENGSTQMVLTCPGLIGVNGMNSDGVAVCCNTLLQLQPSLEGVPCLFVVRGVLENKNLKSAESWLKKIPHAVGQNYTLGDRSESRAFECCATSKKRFKPVDGADFTFHTNHPLVNTDWHPDYVAQCKEKKCNPEEGLYVCHRFKTLQQRIQKGNPITEKSIIDTLASRDSGKGPICGEWNYACTVFVLGETPELHISPGRADRYRMQTFRFE
jgi:isopenicillin-N N-acyltransferase-like protein